jgi:AraC-like DNA-binding protein
VAGSCTSVVERECDVGRSVYATRVTDRRLVGLLERRYVGFRQAGTSVERWIEPPRPAVTPSGLTDTHDVVEFVGAYACLDLKLTPLGAYTLLGFPLHELPDTVCALDEVFGEDGRRLSEQLHDAHQWEARFDAIEAFLLRRAAQGPRCDPALAWAWSRLCETEGRLAIGALAAELGCSRRHLSARFRETLGRPRRRLRACFASNAFSACSQQILSAGPTSPMSAVTATSRI